MELKKFKEFRTISKSSNTDSGIIVEVKKTNDYFVVCINGLKVESFKTKEAAEEAAEDAIEAMKD